MRFISLLIGKTILKALRLAGRSGSALPGLVVEKLNPKFLGRMLDSLPMGVIVVTGTNGKTTTTKIIAELLESVGTRVLTNKTGSNFVRGTVTTVVDKAKLNGKLPFDIAVFELDEAHAVHFVSQVKPRGVVVLNIMRDQMDRFGEIDTTAKLLQTVVSGATAWVVLNANDQRAAKLKPSEGVKIVWYGHNQKLQNSFLTDDELYHQDNISYSTAGEMSAELVDYNSSLVKIKLNSEVTEYSTPLNSSHNAINLTAALAVLDQIKPERDMSKTIVAVSKLQPAFGRGEVIDLGGGRSVTLQLVKNPGGFTHALHMLDLAGYSAIGMVINDNYADGRDVSWLWDVDFNMLEHSASRVVCGGTRGYDMAVRLKYDEVKVEGVDIELGPLVKSLTSETSTIIFCTYTAMLKIRDLLHVKKVSV